MQSLATVIRSIVRRGVENNTKSLVAVSWSPDTTTRRFHRKLGIKASHQCYCEINLDAISSVLACKPERSSEKSNGIPVHSCARHKSSHKIITNPLPLYLSRQIFKSLTHALVLWLKHLDRPILSTRYWEALEWSEVRRIMSCLNQLLLNQRRFFSPRALESHIIKWGTFC